MATNDLAFPLQRRAAFREWSPSIHYAKFQRMERGALAPRRIYNFELLYVSQGEAATTMNGRRYELSAGQLVFLPSGVYHQNEAVSASGTRFLGIHFDFFGELDIHTEHDMIVSEPAVLPGRFAMEAVSDMFPPLSQQAVYTPTLSCVALMEQLVHEFTMRPLGYELACKALMLNILSHLLRLPLSRSRALASQHDNRLLELVEEIEQRPSAAWTNGLIADRLGLSLDHAAKLFKELVGQPPGEYVSAIRHREARRLLRETDMTIEQIGDSVGYVGIHYFSRQFRKHEGISATEYRKLSQVL
ncbi:AraC family transcriptional regulator [Paenibacillus sp. LHD-117]|uniref:AraC family transcriptional regulator n=1 Tax=Paenibacillus sp. LHD-117 TaxID=3071412 RepID=UPI0027E12C23|nr:AraC family transcriptional regulator [Paenibacillus sp. LHD-117]MDQ6421530.1 AraC family transcriptional regulator [Paenibacillus sp. LHD-117]